MVSPQTPAYMLTGDQIAAARRLAGFASQRLLADAAAVSEPTVARAEAAKRDVPRMGTDAMAKIVRALEAAGIEFSVQPGVSLAGGVGMRMSGPKPGPKEPPGV